MSWNIDDKLIAVYPDMKSHTGACLTLGHRNLLSLLSRQKINTKSSAADDLVGVDNIMIFVMWMKHFFES